MIKPPYSPHPPHWFPFAIIVGILTWLIFGSSPSTARGASSYSSKATYSDYRQSLVKWEGYRTTVYHRGPREPYLVGIGHKLTPEERRAHPSTRYTMAEVERLFNRDLSWALDACRSFFTTFDRQPKQVQIVLVNVAFTVGRTGLTRWTGLRWSIDRYAYNAAANELGHSKWFRQVQPARANFALTTLRNAYSP